MDPGISSATAPCFLKDSIARYHASQANGTKTPRGAFIKSHDILPGPYMHIVPVQRFVFH